MTVCFKGRISFPLLFIAFFAVTFSACRKNEETVGNDFVGDIVGFDANTVDTSTIIAYTTYGDSIVNSLTRGMYYFYLGSMNDPDFGKTSVAPVVQFSMPTSGGTFDITNATIDSIVLQVKYVGADSYYGNKSTEQTFKVYELAEVLSTDSGYATNRKFLHNTTVIGSWQGSFENMDDSVKFTFAGKQVSLPPHMRIKLDDPAFIQKFKNAKASGAFDDNKKFQSYFKGLIVKPETNPLTPGNGCLSYVHLRNGNTFDNVITSVVLYYDSVQKIEFPIYSDNNVKAAAVTRNKDDYSVVIPIQPAMGGHHEDLNYVQAVAGLKTRILIPYLFDFVKNKNISITGASLIVTAADNRDLYPYSVPTTLRLDESDSLGVNNFSTDLLNYGASFYGGTYNSSTKQYTFNISKRVQDLLKYYKQHNQNIDYGFNLYVPTNPATGSRVIIDTRPGKIKLKLSYTVIH